MKYEVDNAIVCLVGLGYVGLPLAEAFAKSLNVIGFDTDFQKVQLLKREALEVMRNESEVPT